MNAADTTNPGRPDGTEQAWRGRRERGENLRYCVEFAGCRIRVGSGGRLRDFLADYLAEDQDAEADFQVEEPGARDLAAAGLPDNWPERLRLTHERVARGLLRHDVLLCHASALALDGRAYLFCGPSGVGKSTHAALWRDLFGGRVTMLCDDKPWLRVRPEALTVYGSPWDGKHRLNTNASAPLAAFCFLEQAPDNRIEPLTPQAAVSRLLAQLYYWTDAREAETVLRLAQPLLRRASLWLLRCAPTPEAARLAHDALRVAEG